MDEASSGSYLDYIPLQLEFGFFPRQKVRGLDLIEPTALLPPWYQFKLKRIRFYSNPKNSPSRFQEGPPL